MDRQQHIDELESQIAALAAEVRALRGSAEGSVGDAPSGDGPGTPAPAASSRRNLLKLAGAAAAGTAAALAARPGSVAAADGDPIRVGQEVASDTGSRAATVLRYANSLAPQVGSTAANLFLVRDQPETDGAANSASPTYPAAIGGYAFRAVQNGIYGYTQGTGYGVVARGAGSASIGLYAIGAKANLQLSAGGEVPSRRLDAHAVGEITLDTNNDLWVCVVAGTPGTWRKLTGPSVAGAFHALAPSRVYDSRAPQPQIGALTNGQSRVVSVAAKRDTISGNVVPGSENLVPVGATAIACNVTVVNTVAGGVVTVNPGGVTAVEGATVNWSSSGQILNNGVIVKLNEQRQVTIVVSGTAATRTDVVVDVTGYFL